MARSAAMGRGGAFAVSGAAHGRTLHGQALVAGRARGPALVLDEPLSFWGGMEPETGRLIDPRHPQVGAELRGCILLMPSGRGSSSSSSVLAEAVRLGTSPAAVVLLAADPIVALGSIVAAELYGRRVPVVTIDLSAYMTIASGDVVEVDVGEDRAILRVRKPGGAEPQP
jgi:uncharacterized protein